MADLTEDADSPALAREAAALRAHPARDTADRPSAHPEVTFTMPVDPDDHWRDVDGTPIPPLCRFEQIAVDAFLGAEPLRLHWYGRVIDRGMTRLFVLFDDESTLVRIRPHLVRVLPAGGG